MQPILSGQGDDDQDGHKMRRKAHHPNWRARLSNQISSRKKEMRFHTLICHSHSIDIHIQVTLIIQVQSALFVVKVKVKVAFGSQVVKVESLLQHVWGRLGIKQDTTKTATLQIRPRARHDFTLHCLELFIFPGGLLSHQPFLKTIQH